MSDWRWKPSFRAVSPGNPSNAVAPQVGEPAHAAGSSARAKRPANSTQHFAIPGAIILWITPKFFVAARWLKKV
ncbi:hypothetical protein GS682_26790 [Nostoc sp. B(2019)]|nr:hypothetical protein [Nostoc sp. B(2019)]